MNTMNTMNDASKSGQQVRIELLRPQEIRDGLTTNSTVFVPLGTIEWHGEHLPVGLDALTAHGVCIRAATLGGGLVYPPLYFGTGGDHGPYPFTVMMPTADHLRPLIEHLLERLLDFGVARVVLFSGHFAPGQLDMIAEIAHRWNRRQRSLVVVARGVNMAEGLAISPDHAGVFETTLLASLWPDRVDLDQLPALADMPAFTDDFAAARHDPEHPLWGVFGPDPRAFDPDAAAPLLEAAARWLADTATASA
jgi:creatinine amidohydrolase